MKLRIPHRLVMLSEMFMEWANVPMWTRGRFELRRIDVLLVLLGIVCVAYYAYTSGWIAGLAGGALFILFAMIGLWLF